MRLTRAKFEQLTADLVERCAGPVQQALAMRNSLLEIWTKWCLVGGSPHSRVQALVRRMTGGKEPNQSVNPDEVVAIGAAIQAGVLSGEVQDGCAAGRHTGCRLGWKRCGRHDQLIGAQHDIPVRRSETYSTADDNQSAVDIHVLQGERELARDNRTLGHFRLEGMPRAAWLAADRRYLRH